MNQLLDLITSLMPLLATTAGVFLFLFAAYWFLLGQHPEFGSERRLPRQLAMLGLTAIGAIAIALALPVSDSTRNQVIALIGMLLSGVVAFSSTTIVSNLMARLVLHVTRPFHTGDFIRVENYFGRVAGRGLFNTEIQTERRELVYLSNTYLISHPVAVVRSSGTIVSATLSLGYDVHHSKVKNLLIAAAHETGLEEPFVEIVELGNHAITYHVSGLLTEIKGMLSARSNFYGTILDTLNGAGIEIVSPTVMSQRHLADDARIMPAETGEAPSVEPYKPEEIMFDKAEQAEQREKAKLGLQYEIQELEDRAKTAEGDARQQITDLIEQKRNQLVELENGEEKMNGKTKVTGQDAPAGTGKP